MYTSPKRHEVVARRHVVSDLYRQGTPQYKIAEQLGVSTGIVSNDLAVVRRQWLRESTRNIDERRAEELAKIDLLEAACWMAWHESRGEPSGGREVVKSDVEVLREGDTATVVEVPTVVTRSRSTYKRYGESKFLERIAWCIEQRCKLLKLLDVAPVMGGNTYVFSWDRVLMPKEDPVESRIKQITDASAGSV